MASPELVALGSAELLDYYRRRASEYEAIYAKPERQADLAILRQAIPAKLRGARVLEIACGTGYWTQIVAEVAAEVVATDLAEEPMQIAQSKQYNRRPEFEICDAYSLPESLGRFDAALAVFWWSHVPRQRISEFLASLHARLARGARVVLMDNTFVEGSSTPISEIDAHGNTYQLRRLGDGSQVRVLKNFPSESELRACLPPTLNVEMLEYYWLADYRLP
ncbi:MAG TPA: methyltransferase domain-containing protein [Burkholderiales bacterium]|nr:methyltransferase domain-containing protein [Burkholderiales bacterium]